MKIVICVKGGCCTRVFTDVPAEVDIFDEDMMEESMEEEEINNKFKELTDGLQDYLYGEQNG